MGNSVPIVVASITFPSKEACRRAVRSELNSHPIGQVFQSTLISDLISEHHPRWSELGHRPTEFRRDPPIAGRSGYTFYAYFPQLAQWKKTSAFHPIKHLSADDRIREFLRDRIRPIIDHQYQRRTSCEICGRSDRPLQDDHADPEFKEMYRSAMEGYSAEDLVYQYYIDGDRTPVVIPDAHPVVVRLFGIAGYGRNVDSVLEVQSRGK